MRRGTTVWLAGGLLLLLLAACTRTAVVSPAPSPDRRLRGSRPPPNAPLGPDRPADPQPPPSTAVTLGIPPGHLPDPGQCRVWIPGTPPGRQPRPRSRSCAGIAALAPAGSWILYRPSDDRRVVHVRVVDERRPGTVVRVRIYDLDSQELLQEEEPEEEPRQNERPRDERPPEPPAGPTSTVTLAIPPGHLPELGECRVWIPRLPPGLQPKPKSRACDGIVSVAPAGSWIIDRPRAAPQLVYVRLMDEHRAGVVIRIRVFDIDSKRLVREENP